MNAKVLFSAAKCPHPTSQSRLSTTAARQAKPLSEKTIKIVKATAPVMAEHGYTITRAMYKNMFSKYPEVKTLFNHNHQIEKNGEKAHQPASLAAAVHAYAANIDNLEALGPAVERIAQKHVSLNVTPAQYDVVGVELLGAVKEVLGDAATQDIMNAWHEAYQFLAALFINREQQISDKSAFSEGGWRGWRDFSVSEKIVESPSVSSFILKPTDEKSVLRHKPGQYIGFRMDVPDVGTVQRNYSISSNSDGKSIRVTIQREGSPDGVCPYGVVSNHFHDNVEVGTVLKVSVPAGDFFHNVQNEPTTLVGAGIGITPLMSMYEHLAHDDSFNEKLKFIVLSKEAPSLKLHDRINQIAADNDNFSNHFHSSVKHGRLSKDELRKLIPSESNTHFYFCGPRSFMLEFDSYLNDWNVPREQSHFEFFGPNDM